MYSYVDKKLYGPCQFLATQSISEACRNMKQSDHLYFKIYLIGSASTGLITSSTGKSFDLDFNLVISSLPTEYANNLQRFKDLVRKRLDQVLTEHGCSNGQDSTSAITYSHLNGSAPDFCLDICILKKEKDDAMSRLVHHKNDPDNFTWDTRKDFSDLNRRENLIASSGKWEMLRDKYLKLKEKYASDPEHPSFVVYSEAVNLVWQQIPQEEIKMSKGKVSGNTHTQQQMNHHANQGNPNNAAHKAASDNHANQMNPNHK